ncbi:MAG: chemotaxis protein CheA [Candidatus Hinthialibacter antarcticus]|nr:chemotaxis protein CheA [Candidatus Hinthialibacter antarcticus]
MSFDTQQYIELFYQDAEEHLQLMTDALLDMEKDSGDKEALGALFRAAHTLKSSSAMVGFMHVSEFTHKMEDLIGHWRDSNATITTEQVNLLFSSFDVLKDMLAHLQESAAEEEKNQVKHKASDLIAVFKQIVSGEEPEQEASNDGKKKPRVRLDEELRNRVEEFRLAGEHIYELNVEFKADVQMAMTRAYLIVSNVEKIGNLIASDPSIDGDGEEFGTHFTALIASHESEDNVKAACDISDVESTQVREVTESEQFEWGEEQEAASLAAAQVSTPETESPTPEAQAADAAVAKKVETSFDRREDRSKTQTVRVNIEKLDRLLNLAAELVIQRGRAYELTQGLVAANGKGGPEEELLDVITQQGMFMSQLQETIMEARMVPMGMVFSRFRRVVRDLAQARGKKVSLVIEGEETELDKKIIDQIGDPLMHMVRNAVDHGLETTEDRKAAGKAAEGELHLDAIHQGNNIVIKVRDDGHGLNADKLKNKAIEKGVITPEEAASMSDKEAWHLIFRAGFSTAKEVTDISGRGVGMDVVRRSIEQLGGSVEIDSKMGEGTTFSLKLPLTLAIIQALLVETHEELYALPISAVSETIRIERSEIFSVQGKGKVIRLRDEVVPILNLSRVVGKKMDDDEDERLYVAVLRQGNNYVGIIVDRMVNEQEIVIKSLGGEVSRAAYIAGAAILGNGKVILILDTASLVEKSLGSAA